MINTKNNMKTIKIVFLVLVSIIMSQRAVDIEQISPLKDEGWADFKKRVNENVTNDLITRSDAESLFSGYRSNYGVRDFRQEEHDKVMQKHFLRHGVKNIGALKNKLFDAGIKTEELDSVLGGLLKMTNSVKKEGRKFKINDRMKSYFIDRLNLNKKQVNYLIYIALKLNDKTL